jgi:eukaryotic-like serine/threonine-protein kinase
MDPAGERIGPYLVRRRIGSGGMGEVFEAIHERMDQRVALKRMSSEAAREPQLVARFIQEGRALAQLQHPGIVRVLACDTFDDGIPYLAMELLEGISLREWIRQRPAVPSLEAALALAHQITDAMVEVHARSIIHRDLKPENVFLIRDDAMSHGLRVKILDFGIAKVPPTARHEAADTHVQTSTPILGTATYMAPEQCRDAATVTDRADIYALGVLLFEMIAGRPPFVADDAIQMITLHLQEPPPPLQQLASGIPTRLSIFVASMLAKEAGERPSMLRCRDLLGRDWEAAQDERDECPFPGLQPFAEMQAELFFGRDHETAELLALLEQARAGEPRWVQIEGPSGVGKSSLIQAALLPHLRSDRGPQGDAWKILSLRPSEDPLHSLAHALASPLVGLELQQPAEALQASLLRDADALRALVETNTPAGCTLLLVVEQLEEIFTIGEAHRRQFDELVATALTAPSSPLRLLTTLRSDFLHRLDQLPRLAGLLNQAARYHLRTMDQVGLERVVRNMAMRAGLQLDEGLSQRIGKDAAGADNPLPLLGHTLRGLWSPSGGARLTHQRYEQLGGVSGALAQQAERLLADLGEPGRERAKWIFFDGCGSFATGSSGTISIT